MLPVSHTVQVVNATLKGTFKCCDQVANLECARRGLGDLGDRSHSAIGFKGKARAEGLGN